jgi:hypothetical protein
MGKSASPTMPDKLVLSEHVSAAQIHQLGRYESRLWWPTGKCSPFITFNISFVSPSAFTSLHGTHAISPTPLNKAPSGPIHP